MAGPHNSSILPIGIVFFSTRGGHKSKLSIESMSRFVAPLYLQGHPTHLSAPTPGHEAPEEVAGETLAPVFRMKHDGIQLNFIGRPDQKRRSHDPTLFLSHHCRAVLPSQLFQEGGPIPGQTERFLLQFLNNHDIVLARPANHPDTWISA